MKTNPHTGEPGCCTADCVIDPKTVTPNPVFEEYHREVMYRYGQSAILAWYGDTVVGIMFNVLNEFFGDGPRVCLKITLAAADSGQLPLDADCISIATQSSYCDLPDAAVVLRPVESKEHAVPSQRPAAVPHTQ